MRGPVAQPVPIPLIDALLKCAALGVPDASLVAVAGILAKGEWQKFAAAVRWIESEDGRRQLEEARRGAWVVPAPTRDREQGELTFDAAATAALSQGS